MSGLADSHARGLAIAALGGLTLTIDIPLIRLADGEPWSVLMVRSAGALVIALIVWCVLRLSRAPTPALLPGGYGVLVAALYGLTSITFMLAVFTTTTANLVFILAFNPMFTALLSWVFLKERPVRATIIAMVLMVVGVLIIVGDGLSTGRFVGDALALASAFMSAAAITLTRASGRDMGFAALVSNILPLLVAAAITFASGIQINAPIWIILNGVVVFPLAFFCLAIAPKYISGPEVAMFYLLETVLAPIWIWMIFSEVPTRQSMLGGGILIATLIVHSLWALRVQRMRST